jgi:hypothetical protein
MTTSSLPDARRDSQALSRNFVATPIFQVTKGNNFSAKTAFHRTFEEEGRIAIKPRIHAASRVFLEFEHGATLTGFEPDIQPRPQIFYSVGCCC